MKKKMVKVLSMVLLTGILAAPLTVLAAGYQKHSYTYDFKYQIPRSNNYLLYPDNYIYMYNSSEASGGSGSFYVTLYRADTWGSTYMGEKSFPRSGSQTRLFDATKVFEDYWFTMRKADDGRYVTGYGTIRDYQ